MSWNGLPEPESGPIEGQAVAVSPLRQRAAAVVLGALLTVTLLIGAIQFHALGRRLITAWNPQLPAWRVQWPPSWLAGWHVEWPPKWLPERPLEWIAAQARVVSSLLTLATPSPAASPGGTPEPCREGLQDPGFETGEGWEFPATVVQVGSQYVTSQVHGGQRALRLGATEGTDVFSYSSAEQSVSIPADVAAARLSFWIYPVSSDEADDLQYVLVLDENGDFQQLMWELTNASGWQRREVSLDAYRGQRVTVRFGVKNDGDGARTAMYVDDVSLALCAGATPTPGSTLASTATFAPGTTPALGASPTPQSTGD